MERDYLIKKWLDNELNADELEAFKKLEDYNDLVKLAKNIKHFKASSFDSHEELNSLLANIKAKKANNNSWFKPLLRIAAILVIGFSIYFYTTGFESTIQTLAAQKTSVELPDLSKVELNAKSTISYYKQRWKRHREVKLQGEAYFKVAKGSEFSVITDSGTVTVLGTEFNVKHREDYFEVICFEGSVGVKHQDDWLVLKPGNSFLIIDGTIYAKDFDTRTEPSWIHNESYFKSIPYKEVLEELERQYNITLHTENINVDQLFTGTFKHDSLELALKSLTLPLNLNYQFKNDSTIVLSRE